MGRTPAGEPDYRYCAKIDAQSEMDRSITQGSIASRVCIYRGDLKARNETARDSYTHTDVVLCLKDALKANMKKPKQ